MTIMAEKPPREGEGGGVVRSGRARVGASLLVDGGELNTNPPRFLPPPFFLFILIWAFYIEPQHTLTRSGGGAPEPGDPSAAEVGSSMTDIKRLAPRSPAVRRCSSRHPDAPRA